MTEAQHELQPGDWVAGRYVILEEIGRGGFGIVYRAIQEGIKRPVALKIVRRLVHEIKGFNLLEAFRQEALHTSRLKHPNNMTLFDFGETEDGMLYLVAEFLEGETLYERMWRLKRILPAMTVHIIKQVAKGLGEAHGLGIIHGDLKPANVFLCEVSGEEDFVKLVDFGIAKIIGEVDPAGLGTPEYMSPEQFAGKPLLAASDVYSVGVILYEMLTGRRPFESQSTQRLAHQHQHEPLPPLPADIAGSPLGHVVQRATAKEPGDRYVDGLELFHALDKIGDPSKANLPTPDAGMPKAPPSPRKPLSRARRISALSRTVLTPSLLREDPATNILRQDKKARTPAPEQEELPLIGRQAERQWWLDQLDNLYQQRQGAILLLGGTAGSGKTRLMRWLNEEAARTDEIIMGYGSWHQNPPHPFEALAEALAEALGHPRRLALQYDLKRLERRAAELLGSRLQSAGRAALRMIFSQEPPQVGAMEREQAARLLVELGMARPLVLCLDNMRWGRSETLMVLEQVAQMLTQQPAALMIIGVLRREALPTMGQDAALLLTMVERFHSVRPAQLTPLQPEDARQLAREVFELEIHRSPLRGEPSATLLDTIVGRSFGNPLYLRQWVGHVIQQELLSPSVEGLVLNPGVPQERLIPPRFTRMMLKRLTLLTKSHPQGRDLEYLLLCCAVLGRSFPRSLLERMLRQEIDAGYTRAQEVAQALDGLLEILAREDILHAQAGAQLGFIQPLMHQSLLERVWRGNGAELHHRAAQTKHQHYAERGELAEHSVEIGVHYEQASEPLEAIRFLRSAAQSHADRGDLRLGVELLERCVRLAHKQSALGPIHLRLLLSLACLKMHLGESADVEALLLLGTRLSMEQADEAAQRDLLLLSGLQAARLGQLESASELLEEVATSYAKADQDSPEDEPRSMLDALLSLEALQAAFGEGVAQLHLSRVLRQRHHLHAADKALARAHHQFLRTQARWGLGHSLLEAQLVLIAQGTTALQEGTVARALELLRTPSHPLEDVEASLLELEIELAMGQGHRDLAPFQLALEDAERQGEPHQLVRAHLALGRAHLEAERLGQAREHILRAQALGRARGLQLLQIQSHRLHARLLLLDQNQKRGALERAARELHEALKTVRQVGSLHQVPGLQLLLGQLEEERGEYSQALEWFSRVQEQAEREGHVLLQTRAHALIARLSRHKRSPLHTSAARTHYDMALRMSARLARPIPELPQATEGLAQAYHRMGQQRAALSLIEQAMEGWRRLGHAHQLERLKKARALMNVPLHP